MQILIICSGKLPLKVPFTAMPIMGILLIILALNPTLEPAYIRFLQIQTHFTCVKFTKMGIQVLIQGHILGWKLTLTQLNLSKKLIGQGPTTAFHTSKLQ